MPALKDTRTLAASSAARTHIAVEPGVCGVVTFDTFCELDPEDRARTFSNDVGRNGNRSTAVDDAAAETDMVRPRLRARPMQTNQCLWRHKIVRSGLRAFAFLGPGLKSPDARATRLLS